MGCNNSSPEAAASTAEITAVRKRSTIAEEARVLRKSGSTVNESLVHISMKSIHSVYDFAEGADLGAGNWGTVRVVTKQSDGSRYACKVLRLSSDMSEAEKEELRTEINVLSKLDHPYIAKLYEVFEESELNLYLVMELLEGGELYDRLTQHTKRGRFSEKDSVELATRMCSALAYLHEMGICHRDLKLENFVFRSKEADNDLVLIDFGLSKRYDDHLHLPQHMHDVVGSSYYIAPEVLEGNYDDACDMWSLGVIVFMLLSGSPPFSGENEEAIMKHALVGKYSMGASVWKRVSDEGKDFVKRCLVRDPKLRMTAKEANQHPWLLKADHSTDAIHIDESVITNLARYAEFADFKRIALQAVAFTLSRAEILNLEQEFEALDSDHDGFITLREFQAALEKTGHTDSAEIKKIFDAMDVDKHGAVHLNEFIAAALDSKYYKSESALHEAFARLDTDDSGTLEVEDLKSILGKHFTQEKAEAMILDFKKRSSAKDPTNSKEININDFISAMRTQHQRTSTKRSKSKGSHASNGSSK